MVNEGFDVGGVGERHDGFGHIEYGASESTVAQEVINYLNRKGLCVRGQATGQLPGVIQRGVSIQASVLDIEEAYAVGKKAVQIALEEGTGYMATILRKKSEQYEAYYDKVELEKVANSQRFIPKSWIMPNEVDVTDDFLRYAAPLIGGSWPEIRLENGLQRFARLDISFVPRKLPEYVPQRIRPGFHD